MAKSTMINFRVKEEDLERIDQAADVVGMDRSSFIRHCVSHQVQMVLGGGKIETVGVRGPALKEKSVMLDPGCPKKDFCRFVKDAVGDRICVTCGFNQH